MPAGTDGQPVSMYTFPNQGEFMAQNPAPYLLSVAPSDPGSYSVGDVPFPVKDRAHDIVN